MNLDLGHYQSLEICEVQNFFSYCIVFKACQGMQNSCPNYTYKGNPSHTPNTLGNAFISSSIGRSVSWLIGQLVSRLREIPHSLLATVIALGGWILAVRSSVCVCVCVWRRVWRCVFVIMPVCQKGAWQLEWPIAKRCITSNWIHRFAQDSVIMTHEPKGSWLTIQINWQKGGVAMGVVCIKKVHYF